MKRVVRALLGLLAAATLVHSSTASAADQTPTLGGYSGNAAASGVHAFYNPAGILPLPPPVDIGAPDAYATIATGPATYARASVLDPGDLLANPDALLSLGSSQWKPGTIPPYPYRVTAGSGAGEPKSESTPAPGLIARVSADLTGSKAEATMPVAAAPAFATVGSIVSTATTTIESGTVTVHAVSVVSNFNLLGLITIDSIITDLTATSQGGPPTLSGDTTISGARAMGQPITIDSTGIHQSTDPTATTTPLNGIISGVTNLLSGNLNDVLAGAGIRITFAGPVQQAGGNSGQLASDGLRIDLEISERTMPALTTLLDAVPALPTLIPGAPTFADVMEIVRAQHLVALELGRAVVGLTTRPTRSTTPASGPASSGGGTTTGSSSPARTTATGTGGTGSLNNPLATLNTAPTSEVPDLTFGAGIGALALLALLLMPLIGDRIAAVAQGVLATGPAGTCTWEER